jgi:VWFA-related protein
MRYGALSLVACTTCVVGLLHAQQAPASPQQTFRSGVDVIQLDVSVLDRDRRPIRGLTAADFTVLEEGRARPIVAFRAIEVPPPVTVHAAWQRDVAEDVVTNAPSRGRVVAIVMGLPAALASYTDKKRSAAAAEVVNQLTPDDLAAVVYLFDSGHSQGFTRDRGRLLRAITEPATMASNYNNVRTHCVRGDCWVDALRGIVEALRALPQQRKTIVFISRGFAISQNNPGMSVLVEKLLREAQRANVVFHAIDPTGLSTRSGIDPGIEGLRTLTENTGGRAVVNDNDPEREVSSILAESSACYLIGFEADSARKTRDGFHSVKVVVNRSDVEVRTRTGYYDPTAEARAKAKKKSSPAEGVDASLEGYLPQSDVPLFAAVAPFAGTDGQPVLAIALGVPAASDSQGQGPSNPKQPETVDVLARAIDSEGKSFGARRLTLKMIPATGNVRYEIFPRLSAPPGKCEVRLGLRTADGRNGSVYAWADVPDFAHAPLTMSGVVLSAAPGTVSGPRDSFADVLPVVPTARRTFTARDRVTAFVRVYQGGSRSLLNAVLTTHVVNQANERIAAETTRLEATSFSAARSADYRFTVPVDRLPAGEYLLTIDGAAGASTVHRAVRYHVQ